MNFITTDLHKCKVVLMCGLAGSGKTTFAKKLEAINFQRLSIDEEIWTTYGRYGIDYPEEDYEKLQAKVNETLFAKFLELLKNGENMVIDFSFWKKQNRDKYKKAIECEGGKWFLVFMDTLSPVLKKRLAIRNKSFEANSAFPITSPVLNRLLCSFETPENEDQFTIKTAI